MWYNILEIYGKCPILLATVMKGVAESVAELKVTKFPALYLCEVTGVFCKERFVFFLDTRFL